MNFTLTRRGDYALRAALHLAETWSPEGFSKIREIADAMAVPLSYTPQVLGLLTQAGLATAKAGPGGGFRLTREPTGISVLEVIEAAEGDLRSTRCILRGGPCRWENACAVHDTWADASRAFRDRLRRTSLAELARTDRRLARADGASVVVGPNPREGTFG
jgi:Rrf2 family protein